MVGQAYPAAAQSTSAQKADEATNNQSRLPEEASSGSQEVSAEKTPTSTAPTSPSSSDSDEEESEEQNEPEPSASPKPTAKKDPVTDCDEFMTAYVESASRKLYRALSAQEFTPEKLKLQDWVEVKVPVQDGEQRQVEFRVHRQKGGVVAGMVDTERAFRRTLVVAMTDKGPVVASHKWPSIEAVASGTKCRPTESRIEYPIVTLAKLDIEPFKFWGLRVLWRLPPSFDKGRQNRDSIYQTIVEVMASPPDSDAGE